MKYCGMHSYLFEMFCSAILEPNHITAHNLTEKQVGQDFKDLYQLLQNPKYSSISKGSLVGPDVGWMGVKFIRGFVDRNNSYSKFKLIFIA